MPTSPNHIVTALVLLGMLCLLTACQSTKKTAPADPWSASFAPPATLRTSTIRLEPLTPAHAQLDYDAFMSSREHLHRTMHWGSWPREDMTVAENRTDLERHEREFVAREAYAYTVLRADRTASLGCIYIDPIEEQPTAAQLNFWVTEAALDDDVDRHLLASVLGWIDESWPFNSVIIPMHEENTRGIGLAERAGLTRTPTEKKDRVAFLWRR